MLVAGPDGAETAIGADSAGEGTETTAAASEATSSSSK
jgi:hypothetical protein